MLYDIGVAVFFYALISIGFYLGISAERRRVRGLERHIDKVIERHRDDRNK